MRHTLKILPDYGQAKIRGKKMFEIRKNDRNFRAGDTVVYTCPTDKEINAALNGLVFTITYVTDYEQKRGYVVYGEELTEATPKQRVEKELYDLRVRLAKLLRFKGTEEYNGLPEIQQDLLQKQATIMQTYMGVLSERLAEWENE